MLQNIYYIYVSRYLLGEPTSLVAVLKRGDPFEDQNRDMAAMIMMEFTGNRHFWILDRHNRYDNHQPHFQAVGSKGALQGRIGMWDNYPEGGPNIIEYVPLGAVDSWEPVEPEGRWYPDAFMGPIGELVAALDWGPEPTTSGRDNLRTMALAEAVYESADSGRRIYFTEEDPV